MNDAAKRFFAWRVPIIGDVTFNVAFCVFIIVVLAVCMVDAWWDWPWE